MSVAHMATIISIGVLATFASGFLCLLVVGIKWASSVKRDLIGEENAVIASRLICARCGTSFFDNPRLGLKDVLCSDCKWAVCSACALRYPFLWLCTACIKSRDKLTDQGDNCLKDLRQRFVTIDVPSRRNGRRESEVRNLIEVLVENILGVCFENVTLHKLCNDIPYLDFIEKFEGVLSLTLSRLKTSIQLIIDGVCNVEDTPSNIEMQLRELIQEIIEEASNIDSDKVSKEKFNTKYNIASKTYEDILAIAILNKIIENVALFTLNGPKPMDILLQMKENQNSKRECIANIKLEAKIRELSDFTANQNNWTNLKITCPDLVLEFPKAKRHGTTWEENWLFRRNKSDMIMAGNRVECYKRRLVPMFIPSPNNDVTPRIGDSCVDDISDLSDLSDSEVELLINEDSDFVKHDGLYS